MTEKTREEIESLKANWLEDGCWDIEVTEGFEAHYDELKAFADAHRAACEEKFLEMERKHTEMVQGRADEIGCSLGVMSYILSLEGRLDRLEKQFRMHLEASSIDLQTYREIIES